MSQTKGFELVKDIENHLDEIERKFGIPKNFSFNFLPKRGKFLMNLHIKKADDISKDLPIEIKGWPVEKIRNIVLPILSSCAEI